MILVTVGALGYGAYFYVFKLSVTGVNNSKNSDSPSSTSNQFNPLGTGSPKAPETNTNPSPSEGEQTAVNPNPGQNLLQNSKFKKITDFAVSGFTFLEDTRSIPQVEGVKSDPRAPKFEIVPSLKYTRRSDGHIYETYLDNGIAGKISNSTIPNIYESVFDSKAQTVIYRYLSSDKSIASFIASLGGKKGDFLPPDIIDLSLSRDKTKFFYLIKNQNGVTGSIQSFDTGKRSVIFNSSYTEWLSQWVTPSSIFLTTKASGEVSGYLYNLNTTSGSLRKILGPVIGLTTLASNDGSLVLYSASTSGGISMGVLDIARHTTKNLNLSSLPEKCVWGASNLYCAIPASIDSGTYPDSWYQGITSFNDNFVKIDAKTLSISNILGGNGEFIDATHLSLDDKESKIFFINKKDSTLWSLDLK